MGRVLKARTGRFSWVGILNFYRLPFKDCSIPTRPSCLSLLANRDMNAAFGTLMSGCGEEWKLDRTSQKREPCTHAQVLNKATVILHVYCSMKAELWSGHTFCLGTHLSFLAPHLSPTIFSYIPLSRAKQSREVPYIHPCHCTITLSWAMCSALPSYSTGTSLLPLLLCWLWVGCLPSVLMSSHGS